MSTVFSIHNLEPRPGVSFADYEKVLLESLQFSQPLAGWKMHLVKGDRGDRKGRYAVIYEFDSVEVRNRYFPAEGGEVSQEVQQMMASLPTELAERFNALVAVMPGVIYTDYVEQGT
jgi:hypothetical protein